MPIPKKPFKLKKRHPKVTSISIGMPQVPIKKINAVALLRQKGLSVTDIAGKVKLSYFHVREIIKQLK